MTFPVWSQWLKCKTFDLRSFISGLRTAGLHSIFIYRNVFVCSVSGSAFLANSKWVYFLPELTKGIDSNSQAISFETGTGWRCLYNSPPPLYPHLWIHVQLHHFWEYYHCVKTGVCVFRLAVRCVSPMHKPDNTDTAVSGSQLMPALHLQLHFQKQKHNRPKSQPSSEMHTAFSSDML